MVEKVIPQSLNYADLKPEAIENEIKLVRFTPTATVNNAQSNDVIKFVMQGNGFFDPYSAYIKMTVTTDSNLSALDAGEIRNLDRSAHSFINRLVIRSQGVELERIEQYDVLAAMINDVLYSTEQEQLHHCEGFPTKSLPWSNAVANTHTRLVYEDMIKLGSVLHPAAAPFIRHHLGEPLFHAGFDVATGKVLDNDIITRYNGVTNSRANNFYGHQNGARLNTFNFGGGNGQLIIRPAPQTYTFIIPIYSGILGVLMPDKKLLPLSLMPLDVEFTLNPHALFTNLETGNRKYVMQKFEIFSHMLFFEQEVHRSLEAVVAENGLFIHFNSFYQAPVTVFGQNLAQYAQINIHFKSINSVHFVFLYGHYDANPSVRKLDFKSHSLTRLQIRNGTFLIPSEPIEGNSGTSTNYAHVQFMIEMYKAWNKLHDPTTDGPIQAYNYCDDEPQRLVGAPYNYLDIPNALARVDVNADSTTNAVAFPINLPQPNRALAQLIERQGNVGRCQYAISLEGEELGSDHQIITGRKAMLPFDINLQGTKVDGEIVSYMMTYVRADFVVYVRPDLVVTLLGR